MPHIDEMFPKPHITADDLNKPYELMIQRVEKREMRPNGAVVENWVVLFNKAKKYLILNKTNGSIIAGLYGPHTDSWIGKKIVLFRTKVKVKGKMRDVVRVREPQANLITEQN